MDIFGIYPMLKDLFGYFKWKEQDKLVEFNSPLDADVMQQLKKDDCELAWVKPIKLEKSIKSGGVIYYQEDRKKRIRYRLVNSENEVLVKRPQKNRA